MNTIEPIIKDLIKKGFTNPSAIASASFYKSEEVTKTDNHKTEFHYRRKLAKNLLKE